MKRHTKISHMIPLEASDPLYPTQKGKFLLSDLFIDGFFFQIQSIRFSNDNKYKNIIYNLIGGFSSPLPNPKRENCNI